MFKSFTRLLSLIICFQLAVGCMNTSQLSVTGADNFFEITGTIVKSFQKINNFILPSAMAAPAVTGSVVVYNFTNPAKIIEIDRVDLYDGAKTFSFKLPLDQVEGQLIQAKYIDVGQTDQRVEFKDTTGYVDQMDMELNGTTTFEAAVITTQIKDLTDPEDVLYAVSTFDSKPYQEALDRAGGKVEDFGSFMNDSLVAKAVELLDQQIGKAIDAKALPTAFEVVKAEAKSAATSGVRMICPSDFSDKVTLLSEKSELSGELTFYSSNAETIKNIGELKNLGTVKSLRDTLLLMNAFYAGVQATVNSGGFLAEGSFKFYDSNKVTSFCRFSSAPKDPEALRDLFDVFAIDLTLKKYSKLEEANADLAKAYDQAIAQLDLDFAAAKKDPKGADKLLYLEEVAIAVEYYTYEAEAAEAYFKK